MKIEQLAQEALKSREEIRVLEATEVSLVALVQNRGLPMTPDEQEKGFLMIEQAHRVIDQLQDDSKLVEITRVPADNLVEIQTGPSGLEPIQIE
jgi:hypothetical protein